MVVLEHLNSRLFLECAVYVYEHMVKHLSESALSETESLELISNTADGLKTSVQIPKARSAQTGQYLRGNPSGRLVSGTSS